MPVRAMDFESIASANSAKRPNQNVGSGHFSGRSGRGNPPRQSCIGELLQLAEEQIRQRGGLTVGNDRFAAGQAEIELVAERRWGEDHRHEWPDRRDPHVLQQRRGVVSAGPVAVQIDVGNPRGGCGPLAVILHQPLGGEDLVQCIGQDINGNMWFGTSGNGVFTFDGKNFGNITINEGLAANNVLSFMLDVKNGDFWVGTYRGLSRFDERGITN